MIDAASFATNHNAFWADQTPTSEHFVRRVNLEHAERWTAPLYKPRQHIRAAFVAELAFSCFCIGKDWSTGSDIEKSVLADTKGRLIPLMENPESLEQELSEAEIEQVQKIAERLTLFFYLRSPPVKTRPIFCGCGFIDPSEGDVLIGSSLFEVKTVERSFRSADIRQLITYSALNYSSKQFIIDRIGAFNPRRGVYFELQLDYVVHEISGRSSQDLFNSIIEAISSGDISR